MIIGLDIDDVIFDTSGVLRDVLGKLENEKISEIKLDIMRGDRKVPGVSEFLEKYLIVAVENAKLMPDAARVIHDLREDGDKIILITARGEKNFPGTGTVNERVLKEAGIEYDSIVYDSPDKVDACRENGVEVFVDDSPKNCMEVVRELGIPVIGFASQVTREGLLKAKIPSVDNWKDLEAMILKMKEEKGE